MEQAKAIWARVPAKGLLITAAVLVVLGFMLYGKFNAINNTGVEKQAQLSAQYQVNQEYLSTYISKFYEQAGIVQAKSAAMDKILLDAVKGRYEGNSNAAPTGTPNAQGGQLISAMIEAYPDLKGLDSFDRILDTIEAGREGYRQQQVKLRDMLAAFDVWRGRGLINKRLISWYGIPNKDLRAAIGEDVKYGEEALDRMRSAILTSSAKRAYETGEMEVLTIPGAEAPSATATEPQS